MLAAASKSKSGPTSRVRPMKVANVGHRPVVRIGQARATALITRGGTAHGADPGVDDR